MRHPHQRERTRIFTILTDQPPLSADADGVIRVGKTRVTLDMVVTAFHEGATAEEIAQHYTALTLAAIYATIGYYLNHQPEIDAYLREGAQIGRARAQRKRSAA